MQAFANEEHLRRSVRIFILLQTCVQTLSLTPSPLCLCFTILCADCRARRTCEEHGYSVLIVSLPGLRAPHVMIPSLACSSRQGKRDSAKCLQTFFPLFLPLVIFKMYLFPRSLSGTEGSAKCIQHTPSSQIRASLPPLRCSTCFKTKEPWA